MASEMPRYMDKDGEESDRVAKFGGLALQEKVLAWDCQQHDIADDDCKTPSYLYDSFTDNAVAGASSFADTPTSSRQSSVSSTASKPLFSGKSYAVYKAPPREWAPIEPDPSGFRISEVMGRRHMRKDLRESLSTSKPSVFKQTNDSFKSSVFKPTGVNRRKEKILRDMRKNLSDVMKSYVEEWKENEWSEVQLAEEAVQEIFRVVKAGSSSERE